jgi:hypothetical protein
MVGLLIPAVRRLQFSRGVPLIGGYDTFSVFGTIHVGNGEGTGEGRWD